MRKRLLLTPSNVYRLDMSVYMQRAIKNKQNHQLALHSVITRTVDMESCKRTSGQLEE